jgi:hypothetical protein
MATTYLGTLDNSGTDLYITDGVSGYTDENGNQLSISSGELIDMPDGSQQETPYGTGALVSAPSIGNPTGVPVMTSGGGTTVGSGGLLSGIAAIFSSAGQAASTVYAQVSAPKGTVVNPKTGTLQSATSSLLSSPVLILALVAVLAFAFVER